MNPIWCLGGAVWDRKLCLLSAPVQASSNPVRESSSPGGVARNVAHNLSQLGLNAALLSAWGDDAAGALLRMDCLRQGLNIDAVITVADAATGAYTAVLGADGNLLLGLAQLDALETLTPARLLRSQAARARAPLQLADLNLRRDTLATWLAEERQGLAVLLAVSEPKMASLPEDLSRLDLLIANSGEWWAAGGNSELARRGLQRALVTQGAQGVRLGEWRAGHWKWQTLPALPLSQIRDVTGAGDAFAAGVLAALASGQTDWAAAARFGQRLSQVCLQSLHSVAPEITPALLNELEKPDAS
ncbi:pseudouridine kinase [Inhella inkyongensis]|uniref:Pseudouridine kinase n=1 Tax=Inhella inkyongensis TaxID=392593 RepID=A0A840S5Z7_9BURK|nr:PfkB family carbohydrate kinase [Inhella inkyongensis]MBB5205835.1 pseudouridine kinase [Inhella inkyongensis]